MLLFRAVLKNMFIPITGRSVDQQPLDHYRTYTTHIISFKITYYLRSLELDTLL
jgi:hypothetical protein